MAWHGMALHCIALYRIVFHSILFYRRAILVVYSNKRSLLNKEATGTAPDIFCQQGAT